MWQITTRNMPSLHTFEAAKEFWDKTPVWKNKNSSWRPLDSVRMEHKRLVKRDDGSYACVLYQTPMVVYYPDKVELKLHSSPSSSAFCWKVSPAGCNLASSNDQVFWGVDTPDGSRFYDYDKGALVLIKQPGNQWILESEPRSVTEQVYDRKLGAEARRRLKPYADWYNAVKRLGGDLPGRFQTDHEKERGLAMLANQTGNINFLEVAKLIGDPAVVQTIAYEYIGAYSRQTVPHDRLPRRDRK